MKLGFVIFWILILATGFRSNGQELVITLLDKDNGQPVELAYVNVYGPDHTLLSTGQTNESGVAAITIEKYPVSLEIVASGYELVSRKMTEAPSVASQPISLTKKFGSLNEVVVTGLSQPQKLKNALSAYQVIPRSVIQAQGAVTLNEVLKNQLNMSIGNDNVLGSKVGMQGLFGDNKVKILIDGMPVNGREAGNVDLSQINLNNVERIEMIQGPMSVVYGTDALGGVINVIMKKDTRPFGINAGWYYESVGKYNIDAGLTFKVSKRHQVTLGGGRNFFEGWKYVDTALVYDSYSLLRQRNLYFNPKEQYIGNLAYTYTSNKSFRLNFASDYINEEVADRGSLNVWDPYIGSYAFDEYYRTKRLMNRLSMEGKLGSSGYWQSQSGYSIYYRTRAKVKKDMVTLQEIPTTGQGDQDTTRFDDVYLRGSYNNKLRKISYTVGYDVNLQYARSLKINGHYKTQQDYALYTNVSAPLIAEKLTAQIGLRASYNTMYSPPFIPAFNLLYTPVQKLQLRASYARGFRAPSLKEKYLSFIDQNHYIIGNPLLNAEESQHAQVSASYQVYEKQADYLQFILTGYFNDLTNMISLVKIHPDDPFSIDHTYANLAHMRNTIGSFQIDGQYRNLHWQTGYSLTYVFREKGYYEAFSASEANASMQYIWRKTGLSFNAFYKFTGDQPFLLRGIDGSATYNGHQDAYHFLDASIEKKLFDKKLQLVAGVKNIFDVQTPRTTGVTQSSGAHGGQGAGSFLPRSIFTSLRLNID